MNQKNVTKSPIVFFDGVCGLCNSTVDFLILRNPNKNLKFATLQGKTAEKILNRDLREDMESIVVYHNGKTFTHSKAVFYALKYISSPWKVFGIFRFLPASLTNFFYNYIAKNRYRWFGQKSICRLPTPEEKSYFLD